MLSSISERNFTQEVLQCSEPVIVNFWAPWCGLCRLIDPTLIQFTAQCDQNIKLVSVNADANLKLSNAYRLKSLPTLLLFYQGQIIDRLEGFHGREDLLKRLEQMVNILINVSV
jgi:thioredoxin 1